MARAEKTAGIKVKVDYELNAKGKPGVKTSEFAGMVIVMVIGLLLTAYGTFKGNEGIIGIGAIMTAIVQGAYSHSRGQEKKGLAQAAAMAIGTVADKASLNTTTQIGPEDGN